MSIEELNEARPHANAPHSLSTEFPKLLLFLRRNINEKLENGVRGKKKGLSYPILTRHLSYLVCFLLSLHVLFLLSLYVLLGSGRPAYERSPLLYLDPCFWPNILVIAIAHRDFGFGLRVGMRERNPRRILWLTTGASSATGTHRLIRGHAEMHTLYPGAAVVCRSWCSLRVGRCVLQWGRQRQHDRGRRLESSRGTGDDHPCVILLLVS
jgi:hypothetical protein